VDPAEAARAPGVTDDAIKVGVTYVDLEAIREVTNLDHGDYEAAYTALFDDINAAGGIHGRRVEPVFAPVSPIGTQPAEEACVELTEDEPVFAVMGFFQADAVLCYLETHDTAVIGGAMTDERLERASAPWFTPEAGSDLETDAIRTLADEGLLDDDFAVFATIQDEALLNDTVVPLLNELGVEPVDTAVLDAPENDVAAQNSATAVIAERFESAGAEKVLVVGSGGVTWANGIEATDYRPQSLFTTLNSIQAYTEDEAGRDLSVVEGSVVAGLYRSPPGEALDEPSAQDCFAVQEEAGLEIREPTEVAEGEPFQIAASSNACQMVTLFHAIAEAAGEDLNYGTFRQAGNELGEVTIPGFPDPFTFGPPPAADGDPPVYLFAWDPSEEDFVVQLDQDRG
jgi:ABC-type branched-subunit amino acid transport system substrate-binding protein